MNNLPPNFVPHIPDNAPFSHEQRAWLNGYLAGLFSMMPAMGGQAPAVDAPPTEAATATIVFGTESGNAQGLAKRLAKEAAKRGTKAFLHDMGDLPAADLAKARLLIVITSTFGDGEPPANAHEFWETLSADSAPRLDGVEFAVLALGDTSYPKFCEFGKQLDARLEALGATRVLARVDCDKDFDAAYDAWAGEMLPIMAQPRGSKAPTKKPNDAAPTPAPASKPKAWSKKNPFAATLIASRPLALEGSTKDVRHIEISLEGSGITYEAGDALGVLPRNCPAVVEDILRSRGWSGDEPVKDASGNSISLRSALESHYELRQIPRPLLQHVATVAGDAQLRTIAADTNGVAAKYLLGREVIDLIAEYPRAELQPTEFLELLKPLQPRLYSISSSPAAHAGQVHVTVGVVRYEAHGRHRRGVCSNFLADLAPGATVPVFMHSNKAFRLPEDASRPVVMIGPGTGIAPFRGFLHERRATGAGGKNWLFFGNPNAATDYFYREEIEAFVEDGTLARFAVAYSRDQAEKLYVQHRIIEHGAELYAWLEEGAHIYVCGDASRMAKDVDAALAQIIAQHGACDAQAATARLKALQADRRYQRDVY